MNGLYACCPWPHVPPRRALREAWERALRTSRSERVIVAGLAAFDSARGDQLPLPELDPALIGGLAP